MFGAMEPTDVKGPLVQFQAAQFSEGEMKRVVKMMNTELAESALSPDVLDSVFEMWWPKLKEQVETALEGSVEGDDEARRPDRDLLEEVLGLTRRLASDRDRRPDFDHPVWDDLFLGVAELARVVRSKAPDEETSKAIKRLLKPMGYLAHREFRGGHRRPGVRVRHVLMELEDLLSTDLKGTSPSESTADMAANRE